MTADERRGFGNIIWLCQSCSTVIDRDPDSYPAEMLKAWKTSAEARASREQGKPLPDEKDIYRMAAMATGTRTPGFYPEAIGNVHKALVDQLEAVDPRFTVSTTYSGGNTTIVLGAKETVCFSIKIGQESADVWRKGLQASIDEGRDSTLPSVPQMPSAPRQQCIYGDESIEQLSGSFVRYPVLTMEPDEGARNFELPTSDWLW